MSVQVSYKKQFVFFIILICITLVSIEGFLRIAPLPNTECAFKNEKVFEGFTKKETKIMCEEYNNVKFEKLGPISIFEPNQKGQYFNVNSDRFRGEELVFEENDYRIFVLGGSTIGGYITSSDELTIPAILEKKLRDDGLNVKVVNAGIGGSTAMDERYYLENYVINYQPNMIIMYDGWNEVQYKHRSSFTYDEFVNFSPNYNYRGEDPSSISGPILEFYTILTDLDYKTAIGILNYFNNVRGELNNYFMDDSEKAKFFEKSMPIIENSLEDSWVNVCKLGEKENFETINILHPLIGTSDRKIPKFTEKFSNHEDVEFLKKINLKNMSLETCENVYDFRNILSERDNEVIYFDRGHMSDFGNEIIAEKIYEKILPVILNDAK